MFGIIKNRLPETDGIQCQLCSAYAHYSGRLSHRTDNIRTGMILDVIIFIIRV